MASRTGIGIHDFMWRGPNFYIKFELTFQMGPGTLGALTVNAAHTVVKELWSESDSNFWQKKIVLRRSFKLDFSPGQLASFMNIFSFEARFYFNLFSILTNPKRIVFWPPHFFEKVCLIHYFSCFVRLVCG